MVFSLLLSPFLYILQFTLTFPCIDLPTFSFFFFLFNFLLPRYLISGPKSRTSITIFWGRVCRSVPQWRRSALFYIGIKLSYDNFSPPCFVIHFPFFNITLSSAASILFLRVTSRLMAVHSRSPCSLLYLGPLYLPSFSYYPHTYSLILPSYLHPHSLILLLYNTHTSHILPWYYPHTHTYLLILSLTFT